MGGEELVERIRGLPRPRPPAGEDLAPSARATLGPVLRYLEDLDRWIDDALREEPATEGEAGGDADPLDFADLGGGPGVLVERAGGAVSIMVQDAAPAGRRKCGGQALELMPVKVGAASGDGWAWEEVTAAAGGGWTVLAGGRTSVTDGIAYAFDNWVTIALGTYVLAGLFATAAGSEWRFMAPFPKPVTLRKGIHVNAAGTQWAEDWTRAH